VSKAAQRIESPLGDIFGEGGKHGKVKGDNVLWRGNRDRGGRFKRGTGAVGGTKTAGGGGGGSRCGPTTKNKEIKNPKRGDRNYKKLSKKSEPGKSPVKKSRGKKKKKI